MSTRKLPVRSSTTSGLDSASSSGSEDSDSSSGSGNEGVVTRKPMARMANTGTDAAPTPVLSDHDYFDGLFWFFCFLCVVFFSNHSFLNTTESGEASEGLSDGEKSVGDVDDSAPVSENEEGDVDENADDLTIEEQLEQEKKRVDEYQEMVSNLVEQYQGYKVLVQDEKERDQKKIASLVAQLEEQKKVNAALQEKLESSSTVAAAQSLRDKVKALTVELEEQRRVNEQTRLDTLSNLKTLSDELKSVDDMNKTLNAELAEERANLGKTLQQLWALEKQVQKPFPEMQEIRLRVSFDGPEITAAVMVPETDKERQRLLEENEFVKGKLLAASQKQCVLREELEQAKSTLAKSSESERKLSSELSDLRANYTPAMGELKKLKGDGSAAAGAAPTAAAGGASAAGGGGGGGAPALATTPALSGDDEGRSKDARASVRTLQKEAFRIYGKFCIPGVDSDVHLGVEMRQELFKVISNTDLITPHVFAPARSAVVAVLENDGLFAKWLAEAAPKSQEGATTTTPDAGAGAAAGESGGDTKPETNGKMAFEEAYSRADLRGGLREFMEKNGAGNAMQFLAEVEEFAQIPLDKAASEKRHRRRKVSRSRTTLSFDEAQVDDLGGSTSPRRRRHSNRSVTKSQLVTAESPLALQQALSPLAASAAEAASRLRGAGRGPADDLARSLAVSLNPVSDDGRVLALPTVAGSAHARLRSSSSSVANRGSPVRPLGAANGAILLGRSTGAAGAAGGDVLGDVLGDGKKTLHKRSRLQMLPSETDLQQIAQQNGLLSPSSELLSPTRSACIQNLDALTGGSLNPKRMINSAVSMGAVNAILPVHDRVWVANGSGAPIQVFDRNKAQQLYEVTCRGAVVRMALVGSNVWIATQGKDIYYASQVDRVVARALVGHEKGPVHDLVRVGKTVWSVAADSCICAWDPVNMKLRKKVRTPYVFSCLLYVNGVVWIGTILGIVFYDPDSMNKLKTKGSEPAAGPATAPSTPTAAVAAAAAAAAGEFSPLTPLSTLSPLATPVTPTMGAPADAKEKLAKIMKTPVSTLLRVREEVWAVHHDQNMISVWDANTRTVIKVFDTGMSVERMVLVGEEVWLCSRDNHVRCMDIHSCTITTELSGTHDDGITSIAVSKSDGYLRVWTGSSDHTICIWRTGLLCHVYKESGSRGALCAVCKKSLKSFGTKSIICVKCGFAIHAKCFDQVPYGSACPGAPPASSS